MLAHLLGSVAQVFQARQEDAEHTLILFQSLHLSISMFSLEVSVGPCTQRGASVAWQRTEPALFRASLYLYHNNVETNKQRSAKELLVIA